MMDKSDPIADWPILNALLNTAVGATWVSFHHGGGVGVGIPSMPGWSWYVMGGRRRKREFSGS